MADTDTKHIGYPLPSEMFHQEETVREDFIKHEAISDLLDIDLKCPYCEKTLLTANERKEKRKHS